MEASPELQDVETVVNDIADAERYERRSPELGEDIADELPFDRLKDRLAGGMETVFRRGRYDMLAVGQIRQPTVDVQGADIGGVNRLDLEAAHARRDELDGHIVLFCTGRGFRSVDDVNEEVFRCALPAQELDCERTG